MVADIVGCLKKIFRFYLMFAEVLSRGVMDTNELKRSVTYHDVDSNRAELILSDKFSYFLYNYFTSIPLRDMTSYAPH